MKKIVLSIMLLCPLIAMAQAKKPNIIIILADDLGWGDVGFHGSDIKTPNLDRLSREGTILNRYYTAPICSPTRAGLLTGRYPNRFGIRETTIPPWSNFALDSTEVLLPEALGKAGYTNRAIIGKWHLGHGNLSHHPLKKGFTHFYGHYNGALDYFTHEREGELDWHNDYETSYDKGYTTDLLGQHAVESIKKYAGKEPFFIYLAFNAPHGPFQAKKEDLLLYGYDETKPGFGNAKPGTPGKGNTIKQTFAAMVTNMDRNIGQVLQTLKDLNIDDNTIVLFHSDNGSIRGGQAGNSGELRGFKFDEWEGGVRSPAIIKWPAGLKPSRTVDQVMGYVDVMPTLVEIVGVKEKSKKPFDGISVLSALKEENHKIDRHLYLGHGAIIKNDWKLIKANSNPTMKLKEDMLFNIPPDYKENRDLKASNPGIYKDLLKLVAPYDSIVAKGQIDRHGGEKGFKAPKEWKIRK